MASLNKVQLIGHTGKDPEIRYLPSGMAVANLSLATSSKRKDKASGEYIEETQWHRLTFIDRLAEIVGEYVKKGMPIYVEGRLRYGKYTDRDGIERYTTDIVCDQMQMLGKREDDGGGETRQQQRPASGPARQTQANPTARQPTNPDDPFGDMDSDIPL
jgi:single-strand DNA-binding protein